MPENNKLSGIKEAITASMHTKDAMLQDETLLANIVRMGEEMIGIYKKKGKLLIAGNGGSAADAQHFAAEITCQYIEKRKGRPAIALATDTSALTAWSNDYSYESVFARLVEAQGISGDALVVISTSGNSKNLIAAAERAHEKGIRVLGILGKDGGTLLQYCDLVVVVPSQETPRIQECHILLIHFLCSMLDTYFVTEDENLS